MASAQTPTPITGAILDEYDTIIVGAGFAGMYMLHRVRQLGLSAVVFERAPDVGGTWYWNTYPGARCDAERLVYNYAFDPELQGDYRYRWPERFSRQPVILDYARHVAERYDLRRDIRFDTRSPGRPGTRRPDSGSSRPTRATGSAPAS